MNKEIKAFLVNTKAYDDGDRDCGEWVSFPVTKEQMKPVYDRIGIDGTHFKEIFFDDFKTDVAGLRKVLSVHTDIDELNYLAVCLSELPSFELTKLEAIAETKPFEQLETFIDFPPDVDYYVLLEGYTTQRNWASITSTNPAWCRCQKNGKAALIQQLLKPISKKMKQAYLQKQAIIWNPAMTGLTITAERKIYTILFAYPHRQF